MSPDEHPRKPNWTILKVLALLAVSSLLLVAAAGGGDDEERPPIIVNNGSINFEPDGGFLGLGEKGSWAGSGTVWRHEHPRMGPSILRVRATPNPNVCTDGGQPFNTPVTGSSVTIEYGPAPNQIQSATVSIVKRYLQLDFGKNAPVYDSQKQRLIAYQGNNTVRIQRVTVGSTVCTFSQNVKLAIQQLR